MDEHSGTLRNNAGRLRMALEAAHMVAWEFDVATGTLYYSGSRDAMSSSTSGAAPARAFDDRELVADLIQHAARGAGPYSSEFRVAKADGFIWIRNQGETLCDVHGRPTRIIGVALDITERKEAEELMRNIATGVSVVTGEAFFRLLTQHLCTALKTDFACIGELDDENPDMVRIVSIFADGKFWEEGEHELARTPCQVVVENGRCFQPQSVRAAFPLDDALTEMGIEGYLGVRLTGSTGKAVGVMCVMNRTPLKNVSSAETLLNAFASRVAAELERRRWERALRESEVQNRAIVRALPDLVIVSDRFGTILNIYAKDAGEFALPDSYPEKLETVMGAEATKSILAFTESDSGEPAVVEYSHSVSGLVRFYEARTVGFANDRLLTIVRNITSRKLAEEELQESRRFTQRVAETSLNVLFVFDLIEQRNIYTNQRSTDVIGYTPKEIEDMGSGFLHRLMHPDDLASLPKLASEYAVRKDGEIFEHVFRMRHKNGEWRWVHRCATIFNRTADGKPRQILGCVTDITEYKHAAQELQELSARLLNVQDEERRRIARELHDVTGQNLVAIGFNLAALEQSRTLAPSAREIVAECQTLCQEAQKEIRTLSYLLHPPVLDEFGLVGAILWYVDGFSKRSGIEVSLDVNKEVGRLPLEMETDLFRVVQEGLTNIMRHSGSDRAVIRLDRQETLFVLQIEDRRRGPAQKTQIEKPDRSTPSGVGIPGMRERLRQYGGSLEIRFEETGATLTAIVPLASNSAAAKEAV